MKKFIIVAMLLATTASVWAADTTTPTMTQIQSMLDQYAARVKVLENENQILKNEMAKAGIKIPLSVFSGAVYSGTTTVPVLTGTSSVATTTTVTNPIAVNTAITQISTQYGSGYAGFIARIGGEWDKIRDAYTMPMTAKIGGYEFVQTGALDHVFVDILYSGATVGTGAYDAKILYQYDKSTFARKLIGLFEYNKATGFYTTKTGTNPFPGTNRIFIADPRVTYSFIPNTATSTSTLSGTTPSTVTTALASNATTTTTLAEIEAAYTAKRYLTTISLSNTWLTANQPTLDVLRMRYRTYFIIGKYSEALAEVAKIKDMGQLSSAVACEGYVIATYAKDSTLATTYQKICNAK